MFEFESYIRYSEVDSNRNLSLLSLLDYFQDCSVFHSEKLGIGVDYLNSINAAWVLSSWQIRINELPKLTDRVKVQTWPYELKDFYGYRNFSINDPEGKVYADANSIWVLIDRQTGRPEKIPQHIVDTYELQAPIAMESFGRKLKLPKEYKEYPPMVVPSIFIDTNQHMNNSKYVFVAGGFLPDNYKISELRVEYRKPAVQGDIMIPRVTENEDGITVALVAEDQKPYAIVQFRKD